MRISETTGNKVETKRWYNMNTHSLNNNIREQPNIILLPVKWMNAYKYTYIMCLTYVYIHTMYIVCLCCTINSKNLQLHLK